MLTKNGVEIFFIKKVEFKNTGILRPFLINASGSPKRRLEFALGRYIVNFALKNHYKISKGLIEIKNKKPYIAGSPVHFSISHSKDIVAVAFSGAPVGFDIQYKKNINLEKFSARYKKKFKTEDEFYTFWTQNEAKIKLQAVLTTLLTFNFQKDYSASVALSVKNSKMKIFKINPAGNYEEFTETRD